MKTWADVAIAWIEMWGKVLQDNLKYIILAALLAFGFINASTITSWIKASGQAAKEVSHVLPRAH